MPIVYRGFFGGRTGPYFQWNSTDDTAALESYAQDHNLTGSVDVANSPPVFMWSNPDDSTNGGSVVLTDAILIAIRQLAQAPDGISRYAVSTSNAAPGTWNADQFGRPFALGDMLGSEG